MTIASTFNHRIPKEHMPSELLIDSDTYVGFESEYELESYYHRNARHIYNRNLVSRHEDASLRAGEELVFAEPYKGEAIVEALEHISEVTKEVSAIGSFRTSTHIHIDVRGLSSEQYFRMLEVYALIETTLFRMFPDRKGNPYCIPLSSQLKDRNTLLIFRDILSTSLSRVDSLDRYASLNLAATQKFGSLEFRMFPFMNDLTMMIECVNICLLVKKLAVENEVIEPDLVYTAFSNLTFNSTALPMLVAKNTFNELRFLQKPRLVVSTPTNQRNYIDDLGSDRAEYLEDRISIEDSLSDSSAMSMFINSNREVCSFLEDRASLAPVEQILESVSQDNREEAYAVLQALSERSMLSIATLKNAFNRIGISL